MSHRNAPLTAAGRLRLVRRCQTRPIAHVAAEMGISRQCASTWVNRYRRHGERGLADRPSVPHHQPAATAPQVVTVIEQWRRRYKWSAARIVFELRAEQVVIGRRTVSGHLRRLGLGRRRFIDPCGELNRRPEPIVARRAGHMVHVDVKKVGRIPDGGGWRLHGRGNAPTPVRRAGYTYLHSAVDGHTRIAYTEARDDEKATTAADFWSNARAWFAAHGITHIERVITDNGSCYRAAEFTAALSGRERQYRIRPYTPRHNGKVERYNRILAEELLYARPYLSETQRRTAISVWNIHYNYHRPHSARRHRPPATYRRHRVTNVHASYN